MTADNIEESMNQEELDKLLELQLFEKKEELRRLNESLEIDGIEDLEEPIMQSKVNPIQVSEYINLPPDLVDVSFERSGELLDLKILKENIYLKSKRTYIKGLLLSIIVFVLGVI